MMIGDHSPHRRSLTTARPAPTGWLLAAARGGCCSCKSRSAQGSNGRHPPQLRKTSGQQGEKCTPLAGPAWPS
jgi:hypothetical protein